MIKFCVILLIGFCSANPYRFVDNLADNKFSAEFFPKYALKNSNVNQVVSPLSLMAALLPLTEIFNCAAKKELFSIISKNSRTNLPKFYTKNILSESKYNTTVLNKMLVRQDFYGYSDNSIQEKFHIISERGDFKNLAIVNEFNNFVKRETHGQIDQIVTEDDFQKAVIVMLNVIYFDKKWQYSFKNSTSPEKFYTSTGPKDISMMSVYNTNFNYCELSNADALWLPYEGDVYKMVIILPHDGVQLEKVLKHEESKLINKLNCCTKFFTELKMPRFKISHKLNINEVLKAMDFTDIFKDKYFDFTKIKQKAVIDVTEKGTETSATTVMSLGSRISGTRSNKFRFIINRPFIFHIQNTITGGILFSGIFTDPMQHSN